MIFAKIENYEPLWLLERADFLLQYSYKLLSVESERHKYPEISTLYNVSFREIPYYWFRFQAELEHCAPETIGLIF